MATPLKYMYNPLFFERLCPIVKQAIPGFDCRQFIYRVFDNRWPDLELKARVRHIALALHAYLPSDFSKACALLVKLAERIEQTELRSNSFALAFLPDYIEVYGQEQVDESLDALGKITRLVSGEFAIRPFLLRYPDKTFERMLTWSKHPHDHVRRLSSEGCRPRLPWAMGVPALKQDPRRILLILENLKRDPSEFVRRSVANNLNDIAKDHPELVVRLCAQWRGEHANTDWILRHGCRTLLKKGHKAALELHGFNPDIKAVVRSLRIHTNRVKVGDDLQFDFQLATLEKMPSSFRLDYAIDYLTATGKTSRKIFKIAEKQVQPGKLLTIERRQSFRDMTTRKHHPGKHTLSILANGKKLAATEFVVC